jgi:excisionase family DNA binding protein
VAEQTELTPIEAAKKLGVGLSYVYGLIWTGQLKACKVGKMWRVSAESVEKRLVGRG